MKDQTYRVYGYRWVVLGVFMLVNLVVQMLWITYAPITGPAAEFYRVTDLQIGTLAMSFMITYVFLSFPASWVIDKYGFRVAVSIGAVFMAVFSIARGLVGANYGLVLACSVGIAIGQPFLMNSWTKVPANWFAQNERATAVGLVTLANLLGTAVGFGLTPVLTEMLSISSVQLIFGVTAAIATLVFIILSRERPSTPPCPPEMEVRSLMLDGLKQIVKSAPFWMFVIVYFIGLGLFNGISTWIENIIRLRGFTPTDAGTMGTVMIVGGVIGAVIIPSISDKNHKRQRYMLSGVLLAIPGLIGITFATSLWLLLLSAFWMGFFLISVAPVGLQYVAEVTYPAPEGTSNGIIQLFGQVSVVYVYIMEAMQSADGAFTPSLVLSAVLLMVLGVIITKMKDPVPHTIPAAALPTQP